MHHGIGHMVPGGGGLALGEGDIYPHGHHPSPRTPPLTPPHTHHTPGHHDPQRQRSTTPPVQLKSISFFGGKLAWMEFPYLFLKAYTRGSSQLELRIDLTISTALLISHFHSGISYF